MFFHIVLPVTEWIANKGPGLVNSRIILLNPNMSFSSKFVLVNCVPLLSHLESSSSWLVALFMKFIGRFRQVSSTFLSAV